MLLTVSVGLLVCVGFAGSSLLLGKLDAWIQSILAANEDTNISDLLLVIFLYNVVPVIKELVYAMNLVYPVLDWIM